ncbi:MAG TPA: MoaD/ThiS family protein [Acidimicrobiales bacterium]|nr:MoaD/ThiS family protein [Acidimicrobiales bacterium]
MIRVVIPAQLRTLAATEGEVVCEFAEEPTIRHVLDYLERQYPMLQGTIRDQISGKRRPFVRFFAAGLDLSHESIDTLLPVSVRRGEEPFIVLGAIAGG